MARMADPLASQFVLVGAQRRQIAGPVTPGPDNTITFRNESTERWSAVRILWLEDGVTLGETGRVAIEPGDSLTWTPQFEPGPGA